MKTPEQALRGFVRCFSPFVELRCAFCPYLDMKDCKNVMIQDVYNHIQQLESRLAQVERERDAAVDDAKLGTACDTCWYNENPSLSKPCTDCGGGFPMWQWRGVCAENTKED